MAAALALAEMPPIDGAGPALLAVLKKDENARDPWFPHALTAAAARNDATFLKAVLADPRPTDAVSKPLRIVTGHYALRAPVDSVVATVLALGGASPAVATPLLDGLTSNWPRGTAPNFLPDDEAKLNVLLTSLPNDARSSLLTLADRWGKKDLFAGAMAAVAKTLRAQLADDKLSPEQRVNAAQRLLATDDSVESVNDVLAPISPLAPPELSSGLLGALAESHQAQTSQAMIGAFSKFTPASRRTALVTLLRRPEWAAALLTAVENKQLQRSDLAADHWAQLKAHSDKDVAARARALDKTGGASSAEMEAVVQKLMPIAGQKGDAARGMTLFKSVCAVCHTMNGEGGKIGPDLTGTGVRPRGDILIDIVDPNRSVEANFRLWTVTMKSGENYAGRLDSETSMSVDILDLVGKKYTLQRAEIKEMNTTGMSIMPVGFDQFPPEDLASLLEYITSSASNTEKK